ncbi:MAG: choice-of-anchor V domain-containing protein [Bacteroidota bacterium]
MTSKHTFYGLLITLFVAAFSLASSGGRSDARAGAPGDTSTCSGCHSSSGGTGSISLVDPPAEIQAGMTYSLTLRLDDDNSSFQVGGFQIVATDGASGDQQGSFTASEGTRVTLIDRLVQNTPRAATDGRVEWSFDYTAPETLSTDEITFFMVGNAANGNGSNGAGDFSRASSLAIPFNTEPSSTFDPNRSSTQLTVFPNPLPSGELLRAQLVLKEALTNVRVRLFDVTGRELLLQDLDQLQAGEQQLQLDLPALTAGFYALQLEGNGQLQARVPLLIK